MTSATLIDAQVKKPTRKRFKFSGHGSFACRYSWLPKAAVGISNNPLIFADVDEAMIEFGVGKNMVRAMRFWVWATGIAISSTAGGMQVTAFGKQLLLGRRALDPYLEDSQTLWLLHWNLATHIKEPIFAWDFLLNYWQHPEIVPSHVISSFERRAESMGKKLSRATLKQHFEVFLHTYVPTQTSKQSLLEENLDSPFIELQLIERSSQRRISSGPGEVRTEPVYMFQRRRKSEISDQLFLYCLHAFWAMRRRDEQTAAFAEIAHGYLSPGQIFKMPEREVRERLENVDRVSDNAFCFQDSANLQQVQKNGELTEENLLKAVYS